jgi:hypothetical protein
MATVSGTCCGLLLGQIGCGIMYQALGVPKAVLPASTPVAQYP